jgi:hypothetical protein
MRELLWRRLLFHLRWPSPDPLPQAGEGAEMQWHTRERSRRRRAQAPSGSRPLATSPAGGGGFSCSPLRLLQRVDEGPGGFFAGGAGGRVELVDEVVERQIGLAARLGDQVPLGGLDRIFRRAAASGGVPARSCNQHRP